MVTSEPYYFTNIYGETKYHDSETYNISGTYTVKKVTRSEVTIAYSDDSWDMLITINPFTEEGIVVKGNNFGFPSFDIRDPEITP